MSTRSRLVSVLALVAGSVMVVGTASARPMQFFSFSLDGLQETPPNASPAFGGGTATLDDVSGLVTITSGSYNSLTAAISAAHIHGPAAPGVAAGVLITLIHTGGTTGSLSGSGVLSAANIPNMMANLMYVNVHTGNFPGGEIRGQLLLIPTPGTAALAGIAGLAGLRRRRR